MINELFSKRKELKEKLYEVENTINKIQKSCKHENKEYTSSYRDPHGSNYSYYRCKDCHYEWSER